MIAIILMFQFLASAEVHAFVKEMPSVKECTDWNARYQRLSTESTPLTSGWLRQEVESDAQVIFLGENHIHDKRHFEEWFLKSVKAMDPSFNCVFREDDVDQEIPDEIRRYLEPLGYQPYNVDKMIPFPDWQIKHVDLLRKLAREQPGKYKLYNRRLAQYLWDESYNIRHPIIADNIEHLFKSGQCKKAIALYGAWHIDDGDENEATMTVPDYLRSRSIKVKSYVIEESLTYLSGTGLQTIVQKENNLLKAREMTKTCAQKATNSSLWVSPLIQKLNNNALDGIIYVPEGWSSKNRNP